MTEGVPVIAYLAQYRDSGVTTFMIDQKDAVYRKALGNTKDQIAT